MRATSPFGQPQLWKGGTAFRVTSGRLTHRKMERCCTRYPDGSTRCPSDRRIGPWSRSAATRAGLLAPAGSSLSLLLPHAALTLSRTKTLHRLYLAPPWFTSILCLSNLHPGPVGILSRLWTSRCGIGWSLPQQILACWPATNNTQPLPREAGGTSVMPFMHIVRTKRLFLAPPPSLGPTANPYRLRSPRVYTRICWTANWAPQVSSSSVAVHKAETGVRDSKVRLAAAEATLV